MKVLLLGEGSGTLEVHQQFTSHGATKVTSVSNSKSVVDLYREAREADFVVLMDYSLGILELMILGYVLRSFQNRAPYITKCVLVPKPIPPNYEFLAIFLKLGTSSLCQEYDALSKVTSRIHNLKTVDND